MPIFLRQLSLSNKQITDEIIAPVDTTPNNRMCVQMIGMKLPKAK